MFLAVQTSLQTEVLTGESSRVQYRRRSSCLIAVHVRRTDYKNLLVRARGDVLQRSKQICYRDNCINVPLCALPY